MSEGKATLLFSREQVRAVDQAAKEQFHIPGIVLMENAARALAAHAKERLEQSRRREGHIVIVCGGGNNGGDGLAAARHLSNAGLSITIVLTKARDRYKGDAAVNLKICEAMNLPMIDAADDPDAALARVPDHDVVLDGLLGTGLSSEVRGSAVRFIRWMNEGQDAPVLAIDIPSGLDCDTGEPLGEAVRAEETVTFVGWKRGFFSGESAHRYTGAVSVGDIGAPRVLTEQLGEWA